MLYYVTIGDRTFEVDLAGDTPHIDGAPVEADLARIPGTDLRHLLLDAASHPLVAERGEERGVWSLHLDGARFEVEVVDERTRTIRAMTGASARAQGPRPIRAPMPGLIVRVEVEPGDWVRPGQGVVIIEAMKMQNELKAESEGRVAKVLVEAGQAVEKGATLIELEAEAGE